MPSLPPKFEENNIKQSVDSIVYSLYWLKSHEKPDTINCS